MKANRPLVFALVLAMSLGALSVLAGNWILLGTREVTFATDRDVIDIGADEGTFEKIKLTVSKSGIHVKDVKIHFANGEIFDVAIRTWIPAGGETRVIDLPGKNRNIKKVVFWYSSGQGNAKRAVVRLWGKR